MEVICTRMSSPARIWVTAESFGLSGLWSSFRRLNESIRVLQRIVAQRSGRRSTSATASIRHHAIVTGTEHEDTNFIVQLLTNLGVNTGYRRHSREPASDRSPGSCRDLEHEVLPYVVKSEWLSDEIERLADNPGIVIDYAIVSLRFLDTATESRRHEEEIGDTQRGACEDSNEQEGQRLGSDGAQRESILAREVHKLLFVLSKTEAEIILLDDSRLTRDPQDLYAKLRPLLGRSISPKRFCKIFARTAHRSLGDNSSAH
jgi:hypothetical protein